MRWFDDAPGARRLARCYAIGAAGLGAVGLAFQDFALQWQPVPVGLPHRELLAILCGIALLGGGIALLVSRLVALAALLAAIFDLLWVAVLLLPKVVAAPTSTVAWLGVAEIGSLAAGGAMIVAVARDLSGLGKTARIGLGACALVFGASHFVYAGFTAAMVPKWLPGPLAWVYATGLGHMLAGLALVSGIRSRLAATLLAAMCAAFVVLLHLPRVLAAPTSHAEWTMLFIALSIAGAAWTMRGWPVRQSAR